MMKRASRYLPSAATARRSIPVMVAAACLIALIAAAAPQAVGQGLKDVERVRSERQNTERQLQELEDQLSEYESQLSDARRAERSASQQLAELEEEIQLRERLLSTYTQRNRQLQAEVDEVTSRIEAVSADYESIQSDYQRRVTHAYKHGRGVYLALILSAESLDRVFSRVRYLRRFTQQRRSKVDEIRLSTSDLDNRRSNLREAIAENEQLLAKERAERARLAQLKRERAEILARTQTQRSDIEREIERAQQEAQQLQQRIQNLISEEAERVRAMTERNPLAAAEFEEIEARFTARKGALSWPASGSVSEPFGTRIHPEHKTETLNPGIEISTRSGAVVKSVFDGQVTRIFFLPGYGTCVTIRHGSFTTMYANLSTVEVANQQRVTSGQILGEAGTEAEPRGSALFFALFTANGDAVDPAEWLRPR